MFWYLASNEVFNGVHSGYDPDLEPHHTVQSMLSLLTDTFRGFEKKLLRNIVKLFPFRSGATSAPRLEQSLLWCLRGATLQKQNHICSSSTDWQEKEERANSLNLPLWSQPDWRRPNWMLKSLQFRGPFDKLISLTNRNVTKYLRSSSSQQYGFYTTCVLRWMCVFGRYV